MRWPVLYAANHYLPLSAVGEMGKLGYCQGTQTPLQTNYTNGTWPAANRALYLPFTLEEPIIVTEADILNGTGATTGSWDVGVYTADGTRLVSSGAIAQAGAATTMQTISLTNTRLDRGVFYLALLATSASTSIWRMIAGGANDYLFWGALQEATGGTLPATATFATNTTAFLPHLSLHSHSA